MLTAVLVGFVLAAGWLGWRSAPATTFDEHAAAALALLQPDHPDLPEPTPLADEVQAWLAGQRTQEKP